MPEPMVSTPPLEWADEPPFELPGLWLDMTSIPPAMMGRHWLALGETGSGKTRSVVKPLLHSMLAYQLSTGDPAGAQLQASLLVIDPKEELRQWIADWLAADGTPERLVTLSPERRIAFFEGMQHLSVTDRLHLLESVAADHWSRADGNNAHWIELGRSMLRELVQAEELYRRADPNGSLMAEARQRISDTCGVCPSAPPSSFFTDLLEVVSYARSTHTALRKTAKIFLAIATAKGLPARIAEPFARYTSDSDLIAQFNYVAMTLDPFLGAVCNSDVTDLVEFSPFEFGDSRTLSVREQVESGKVVVFSPGTIALESADVVGRVIKTKFFQAAFCRKDKRRPVGYVCDEFQRFITSDPDSGEQSFLDRCRAHRVICVLATQSVASIEYALGMDRRGNSAIRVILNNTAGKIFMRNTDASTMAAMHTLFPASPLGGPHITVVRPATTLRPGEAYYVLADGRWGRSQMPLFTDRH